MMVVPDYVSTSGSQPDGYWLIYVGIFHSKLIFESEVEFNRICDRYSLLLC